MAERLLAPGQVKVRERTMSSFGAGNQDEEPIGDQPAIIPATANPWDPTSAPATIPPCPS